MAAISSVFTIDHVAKMLGEDVEWLWELQIDMEPEDGYLWDVAQESGFTKLIYGCTNGVPALKRAKAGRPDPAQLFV